jgi:8-oxo-dGTP diphosphatase
VPIPRAAAVVLDAHRVLLIKRFVRGDSSLSCSICRRLDISAPSCPGHHYAVVPGGHVEAGESVEDAALRELTEETTLQATIDRLLWTGLHNDRPASYFLMTAVVGVPELSGEEALDNGPDNSFEVIWAGPEDLDALNLFPPSIREPLGQLLA